MSSTFDLKWADMLSEEDPKTGERIIDPSLVKRRAHVIIVKRGLFAILAVLVAIMIFVPFYNALISIESRNLILDCVNPGGACSTERESSQAELTADIVTANTIDEVKTREIILAGFFCNKKDNVQSLEDFERCVDKELKKNEG